VRQLENTILRAVVLCTSESIDVPQLEGADLGTGLTIEAASPIEEDAELPRELMGLAYRDAKSVVLERFSRGYLRQRLRESGGNITHAADSSGIERPNFRKLMNKFGVLVPGREK
jgi:DNA-binding NtrC family response regulator